jgi:hypothetical protein
VKRIFDAWEVCNYSADAGDCEEAERLGYLEEDRDYPTEYKDDEDDTMWRWTNKGLALLRRTGRDAGAPQ